MAQLLAHVTNGLDICPAISLAVFLCSLNWVINTVVSFFPLWAHVNCYVFLNLLISMSYTDDFN
jgi:hypothetical protein